MFFREFKDKKREELEESNSQFDELRSGVQQMLEQLDIDFRIDNNSRMMDSLGEIEEKLNELIAAKVSLKTENFRYNSVYSPKFWQKVWENYSKSSEKFVRIRG